MNIGKFICSEMILLFLVGIPCVVLSSHNPCNDPGLTNGCSIPLDAPFPYKDKFDPACDRHDICYRCGTMYGKTRKNCDDRFRENIDEICERELGLFCSAFKHIYYFGVRMAGSPRYNYKAKPRCPEDWVRACLK